MVKYYILIIFLAIGCAQTTPNIDGLSREDMKKLAEMQKNIEAAIRGQLGNHIWIYATSKVYAWKHSKQLYIHEAENTAKTFIEIFGIEDPISSQVVPPPLLYSSLPGEEKKKFERYILKDSTDFDEFNKGEFIYTFAWLQKVKFFEGYESQLRNVLTFKKPLSDKNKAIAEQMQKENSVSIHFRRGDYREYNWILDTLYHKNAIKYIAQNVENPVFYVFSDDIEWVRQNFKFDYPHTFIDHNSAYHENYMDMQLMTYAKHNIIANSSFSWWGAWLNPNPDKIVVIPSTLVCSGCRTEGWVTLRAKTIQ